MQHPAPQPSWMVVSGLLRLCADFGIEKKPGAKKRTGLWNTNMTVPRAFSRQTRAQTRQTIHAPLLHLIPPWAPPVDGKKDKGILMTRGSRHGQDREVREVELARVRRKLDRRIGGIELSSTKQRRRHVLQQSSFQL